MFPSSERHHHRSLKTLEIVENLPPLDLGDKKK